MNNSDESSVSDVSDEVSLPQDSPGITEKGIVGDKSLDSSNTSYSDNENVSPNTSDNEIISPTL